MAGQGFNMILRDLDSLVKILSSKINLGLDIGSYDNLSKFANETRPKNFIYSLGIDFLKNAFAACRSLYSLGTSFSNLAEL